jgi:hypothetical protein
MEGAIYNNYEPEWISLLRVAVKNIYSSRSFSTKTEDH